MLPSYPQSMLPNIQNPMRYPGIPIPIRPDQIQAKNMVPAQPILSKTQMDYRQVSPITALQQELQKEIMTRSDSSAQQELAQPRISKAQMECQQVIPMMPVLQKETMSPSCSQDSPLPPTSLVEIVSVDVSPEVS